VLLLRMYLGSQITLLACSSKHKHPEQGC
jgi:hypothetical protein